MQPEIQMCTVDDLTGGEKCLRVAQVRWEPEADGHSVFLCHFHAEPFWPFPAPSASTGKEGVDG